MARSGSKEVEEAEEVKEAEEGKESSGLRD
jgi:hypothetical protein